jgi:hypothetical protein
MDTDKKFRCEICSRKFTRSSNLKTHIKTKHDNVSLSFSCYLCRKNFIEQEKYLKHIDSHKEGLSFVLYKKAFDKTIQIFRKHFKNYFSLNDILNETNDIQHLIETQLLQYPKYRLNFLIQMEYILKGENNVTLEREIFNIRSSNFVVSKTTSKKTLRKIINDHLFEILGKEKDMNLPQSGWVSNKVISIDVNFHKMNLLL